MLRHGRLARSGAPREVLEEAELQVSVNDLNVLVWRHIPWHLRHGGINMLNALPPIMRQHGSAVYALDRSGDVPNLNINTGCDRLMINTSVDIVDA